jgi:DNA-binding response OmpR family regulator
MKRILVIDDDEQLRKMLKRMLLQAGYEVIEAVDGLEGTHLFLQQPADLVITDIFMPGKEGLEIIRELRKKFHDVKIIAMSGGSARVGEYSALPLAREFGAIDTLTKPFMREELLEAVRQALGEAQ